jgi:hypothetical protein
MRPQHLGDQKPEPAGADNSRSRVGPNHDLFDDAACSGDRFDEHGREVVDRTGQRVQVFGRQREKFRECTVTADDAKDRPEIAVTAAGGAAAGAPAAPDGDFPDDAPADPFRSERARFLDDPRELVSRSPDEPRVATEQLEIGSADAGGCDADETFVIARRLRSCLEGQST